MANRDQHFFLDDPMDDSDQSSDEDGEGDRIDDIEVDSPFEDEGEDGNGNTSDGPYDLYDGDAQSDGEEDNEDAMTWDTMSEASEKEVQPDDDEWFPLTARSIQLPNFGLPTTTRAAINPQTNRSSQNGSPIDSSGSDSDDNDRVDAVRPQPTRKELAGVVLEYLLHNGHSEVIPIFCKEMNIPLPEQEIEEMNKRNEVRDLILEGKMEEAIERIPPDMLSIPDINFAVRQQHIIEMIRSGRTTEPVLYFRKHLMSETGERPPDDKMISIEKVFALMVFDKEEETEFHVYFNQNERVKTARIVNGALLGGQKKPRHSRLDLLAKAMVYTHFEDYCKDHPTCTKPASAGVFFERPFGYQEFIEKLPTYGPHSINDSGDLG